MHGDNPHFSSGMPTPSAHFSDGGFGLGRTVIADQEPNGKPGVPWPCNANRASGFANQF
jgi:hypothetical protein